MSATSQVLEVVAELDALAASGAAAGEIVAEAGTAIARWWWEGRGDGQADRVVGMVAELVLWCAVAACEHEAGFERLVRAGRVTEAEEAGRRSQALREACGALGGLVGGQKHGIPLELGRGLHFVHYGSQRQHRRRQAEFRHRWRQLGKVDC